MTWAWNYEPVEKGATKMTTISKDRRKGESSSLRIHLWWIFSDSISLNRLIIPIVPTSGFRLRPAGPHGTRDAQGAVGKKFRNFCNQQSGAMRSNNNRKIPKNVLPKRGAQNRKIAQVPLRQPEIDSNIPTHLSVSQRKNVSPRSFNFVRFIETTCDSDVPQSDIATLQDTETRH